MIKLSKRSTPTALGSRRPARLHAVVPAALGLLLLAGTVLSGCGITDAINDRTKIDYKSATKAQPLEIPPDLTAQKGDDRFMVPERAGDKTFSGYQRAQGAARTAADPTLLPNADGARIERQGNQRWLVLTQSPDKVWPILREFWQESGFIVQTESPETGIIETDWAENRAKIPQDFIRRSIGRVVDGLYSTGERDKFRTRVERAGTGSEIYISHRGMVEVIVGQQKDTTLWQPRPSDPELEAEFLRRLLVRLGTEQQKAAAIVNQPSTAGPERARLVNGPAGASVELSEGFDRAWRLVGLALDRGGFTVEDRDRSQGVYFVRYIDPEVDNAAAQKPGFFARLFGTSNEKKNAQQFRVKVAGSGDTTQVSVQGREGKPLEADPDRKTGTRILALLQDQLKQ